MMTNPIDHLANKPLFKFSLFVFVLAILGTACRGDEPSVDLTGVTTAADAAEVLIEQATDIPTPLPPTGTPTPTLPPPSPTPPLAALVNGQMITKAEYEADLEQFTQEMSALGQTLPENYQSTRLQGLIESAIMREAAEEWGITVSDEAFSTALGEIQAQAEVNGGYDAWLLANQYTADEFATILKNQLLASAVIEEVVRSVPPTAEQVRARYIVVDDPTLAQSLLDQARGGANFAELASANSLDQTTAPNGGDLDFIIRGWLFRPQVEDVIFALQPDQISEVIPVDIGNGQTSYYLVQVVERDPARPLNSAQRDALTRRTIEEWLGARLASADIQTFE